MQKQGQVTISYKIGTPSNEAWVPSYSHRSTCERRNGAQIVQNSIVGTQSYGTLTMVERKPIPLGHNQYMPQNRKAFGRRIGGLNLHSDVKLVAIPTQHLLNNRGFSSTPWRDTPSKENDQSKMMHS